MNSTYWIVWSLKWFFRTYDISWRNMHKKCAWLTFCPEVKKVGKLRNQFWFCTALLCLKSHMSSDLQHHNHQLSCQHAIFEKISNYDLKCEKWFLEIHWQVSILFNGNNSPQKCLACSYVNITKCAIDYSLHCYLFQPHTWG